MTINDGAGIERHLHDPIEDRLIPLEPLDLKKVAFDRRPGAGHGQDGVYRPATGRSRGRAGSHGRDKDCFVVMTLAGAMTVAKQGLIIAELIDRGIVNAIVSTGALMAHGLVEATGRAHFRYNPEVSDEEL